MNTSNFKYAYRALSLDDPTAWPKKDYKPAHA